MSEKTDSMRCDVPVFLFKFNSKNKPKRSHSIIDPQQTHRLKSISSHSTALVTAKRSSGARAQIHELSTVPAPPQRTSMKLKHTSRSKSLTEGLGLVSASGFDLNYGNRSLKNGEHPPNCNRTGARKV